MEKTNINDTLRTLIRGIIGTIIVLGILYIMFSFPKVSDYDKCIRKCPQEGWRDSFSNLECPKMCAELNKESEYTWNICNDEGCLSEKNLSFDKTKDCWFDGCNTHCCNEYGDCTMTLLKCYNKED